MRQGVVHEGRFPPGAFSTDAPPLTARATQRNEAASSSDAPDATAQPEESQPTDAAQALRRFLRALMPPVAEQNDTPQDNGKAHPAPPSSNDAEPESPPNGAAESQDSEATEGARASTTGSENARADENTGASSGAAIDGEISPSYPALSRRLGEEGLVELKVRVLADGGVGEVRVLRHPGHQRLVDAAIEAVREADFTPAARGGAPTASWIEVPVRFTLE